MIRPSSPGPHSSNTPSNFASNANARPTSLPPVRNAPPAVAPANTRDAILDAAGVLLGRYGYQKTTMDDLATQAGIARRTLYLHFRCKDDIFLARIDRVVERLLIEERRVADGPGDARERLMRLLTLRVVYRLDVVKDYPKSLDEIFAALRGPYLERRSCWFAAEATVLVRVLEEGRRDGIFVCDDPALTARALISATNSLIPYSLSTKELGSRREIERTLTTIVELALAGLRAEAAKKKR
jgi:AcrR family transcriptional regulator